MKNNNNLALNIGSDQIRLLSKLSNACSVSGDETEVRDVILNEIKTNVDQVIVDNLGNILARRQGNDKKNIRVLVSAHMDEIGFMLTYKEDNQDGIYRFETIGGVDPSQFIAKPVIVGRKHIPAVIGFKPYHFITENDQQKLISIDDLRVDVGYENSNKVTPGDRGSFATTFTQNGDVILGKALDNRVGVTTLINLLKNCPPNIDLLAAFTVQEEIGLRGAKVAAFASDSQFALILDCTPAYDLPVLESGGQTIKESYRFNTHLRGGPALYVSDASTIYDPRLVNFCSDVAKKHEIKYQIRQPGGGSTDAGLIHKQKTGIPCVGISVPGRYLHTACSIISLEDWRNTFSLVYTGLSELSPNFF